MTPQHTDEIRVRLDAIRRAKATRINWRLTHHTAEVAIRAIQGHARVLYRPGTKSRRRKRFKRLL